MRTAAIILIGNELLSGKVVDTNAVWLTGRLRALGVDLRRVVVVPDVEAEIVDELRRCSAAVDHVFTSGGVGPTHDDITLPGVAAAFGVPIVRNERLAALMKGHFGARLTEDHLRMADLPAGTELIDGGEIRWPVMKCRNVYVLPGVPEIFRAKFDAIAERFRDGAFYLRSVYLDADEGTIAARLRALEGDHGVAIGSYPRIDDADHRLRVTFEARSPAPVDAAVAAFVAALPPEWIVRVEPPREPPSAG
ncbi:MAG: competence/damage-inducible protein A [bacterium]|nr:competence/damage-inducible protein A [Myxococcales bacterium]MCB9553946.1 competence/damage-inducible protein A [Myxococcales bacterium]